jgi:hypothetical protein
LTPRAKAAVKSWPPARIRFDKEDKDNTKSRALAISTSRTTNVRAMMDTGLAAENRLLAAVEAVLESSQSVTFVCKFSPLKLIF